VTVCIASLFNWNYGNDELARVAITASDRQITAGDIEYEPHQTKTCFLTPRVLILIAGDYATHSEAILTLQRKLLGKPESDVGVIAELYASFIRSINARWASQTYLSPLGLDQESFLSRHHEFEPNLVGRLADQLQSYQGPHTEAIIVGTDEISTHVYCVGADSKVRCYNDVGFVAIGIGSWHAKSQLMRYPYSSQWRYPTVLTATYAAKKAAEIAPGVGQKPTCFSLAVMERSECCQN
jgi:hypothetical protein